MAAMKGVQYVGVMETRINGKQGRLYYPSPTNDVHRTSKPVKAFPNKEYIWTICAFGCRNYFSRFVASWMASTWMINLLAWWYTPTLIATTLEDRTTRGRNKKFIFYALPHNDMELLQKLARTVDDYVVFSHGVGTDCFSMYSRLCASLASKANALVFIPTHTDGTAVSYYDEKLDKYVPYDFTIPMFTNSEERKEQIELRHRECYDVAHYVRQNLKSDSQKIHLIGHSLGGCAVLHMLDDPDIDIFESVVALGPSIGVGLRDKNWKHMLEAKHKVKVLHVHEDMYFQEASRLSLASRFTLAAPEKHTIVTITNCNHADLMDSAFYHSKAWRRVISYWLPGMFSPDIYTSFDTQVNLTISFMRNPDGIQEQVEKSYKNCYMGIKKGVTVAMERVQASVDRLMS